MPYQNGLNPFGSITAPSARGTLMGNRSRQHRERPPDRVWISVSYASNKQEDVIAQHVPYEA